MVQVDKNACNGCDGRAVTVCRQICPGTLFRRGADGKAELRDPGACWDCCACVKHCPRAALSLCLPFQIAEGRHRLLARVRSRETAFEIIDPEEHTRVSFVVPARQPNKKADAND